MGKTKELLQDIVEDYNIDYIKQIELAEQEYYATIANYNTE